MASLLSLPIEIRQCIIQYVICADRQPVYDVSKGVHIVLPTTEVERHADDGPECTIIYGSDATLYKPNSINLLLTNHQLFDETKACLSRSRNLCRIDAAILDNMTFWPTFTLIPPSCTAIDTLEVKIGVNWKDETCRRYWCGSDMRLPRTMWSFWNLLETFLLTGPCLPTPALDRVASVIKTRSRWMIVKVLDLNITDANISHDKILVDGSGSTNPKTAIRECTHCHQTPCRNDKSAGQVQDFETLDVYNSLTPSLHGKLLMPFGPHGVTMCSQIGKIRIRIRGVLVSEIDLTDMLSLVPKSLHAPLDLDIFRRQRKQNGLWGLQEERERLSEGAWVDYVRARCRRKFASTSSVELIL